MLLSIILSIIAIGLLVFGIARVATSPFQPFNVANVDRANWGLATTIVGVILLVLIWEPYIHTG